ncbi:hypothetical protein [Streptomyces sp. NPDC097619]|uniref:hypothetical protein n=1 Tax=Streptomyces sp. NPDC097619 TaxID=3157228 RepID=UPI00332437AB
MALLRGMGRTLGRMTGRPVAYLDKDADDPQMPLARAAAAAGDWPALRALLEASSESGNRTALVWAIADTQGVEQWIGRAIEAEPASAMPRLVGGFRQITWGWEARTSLRAQHVSREQFRTFHERLQQGEEWLYEAAELEPRWSAPWYGLLVTGRGLQVGPEIARRRFEATVRRYPQHLGAHDQRLQQVCEKWGGSHEEMHAFAREAVFGAPAGTMLGGLVAEAHIEQWLHLDGGEDDAYMRLPEVRESLHAAAEHSYRHPEFVRGRSWASLLNAFAMAFSLAGDREAARECFELTEGRVTESPWNYLDNDPVAAYRKQRSAAGR